MSLALGRTHDPRDTRGLAEILRSDGEPRIRASAARGLALTGGDEAIEALLEVEAGSGSLREQIAMALGVLGDSRAVPRLIAWLDDDAVCSEAAEALGRIGAPEAVPALAALLDDPRWVARSAGRGALAEIGHPEAVEALRRGDRGPLRGLRLRAARRAVERRRAQVAGELPARVHPLPRRIVASAVKELCTAALAVLIPIALLDADPRAWVVAVLTAAALLLLDGVHDRRERHRTLARARWGAQREPAAGAEAPIWATVAEVFRARPQRVVALLALALALESAMGGAGYGAGVVAGLPLAVGVYRLPLARLVSRWQRETGTRLLTGDGRFFAARREP